MPGQTDQRHVTHANGVIGAERIGAQLPARLTGWRKAPNFRCYNNQGSLCTEFFETLLLPIELELDLQGRTAKVHIPGVAESAGRPIVNEFNGEPFHIAIARPAGSFEFTYGEIGRGTTTVTGDLEMAFQDSWALFCVHHYNQNGLIRARSRLTTWLDALRFEE